MTTSQLTRSRWWPSSGPRCQGIGSGATVQRVTTGAMADIDPYGKPLPGDHPVHSGSLRTIDSGADGLAVSPSDGMITADTSAANGQYATISRASTTAPAVIARRPGGLERARRR
jgi:hypothetical protein